MSEINVRVVGSANMAAMTAPFAKLEAQVTALNAQLAKMVSLQNGLDPRGYERMARAAKMNASTYRSAAASTGMFEVQQLRVNKATDDFIGKLQKQKLSFMDMLRQQKLVQAAYREQLKMQQMVATTSTMGTTHGKMDVTTTMPTMIPATKGLVKFNQQLSYANMLLKSGATQMINWGKNTQWAGRQLSMGFTMPIAALGAAAGVMAYQMDQAFTRVQKVYNTTAKGGVAQQKELDQVRAEGMKTAMTAAQQYGSAGKDTLNVQAELAAAGKKGNELQQATVQVMRISRLGELDYNDAIKSTIALQSVFNMNSQKLGETFNYINDVENQTSLATSDFAKAIPIAAAPVKAFGGDIQELGTLLVAMKQNGIEATQGANAIKAAMQRLGRPSAQVQKEWQALTGTDITQIFDKSTSLIDLFTKIGDATANLAPKDQIRAFAGLFGTYQVTRMMAMVKGMEDLKNGVGQVSVAARLAGQDTSQWAKVANQEIDRYQNSISGKWNRAIEDMKLQLSTLGKPFVVVATDIISGLSKVVKWFNKMPDFGKKIIAIPILITALAGPVLMLTGLVANLAGNGLKVLSAALSFAGLKMELFTTNQKAAALASEQTAEAMYVEGDSAKYLTDWLTKMAAAQALANKETRQFRIESLMNQGMSPGLAKLRVGMEDQSLQRAMNETGSGTAVVANNSSKIAKYARMSAVSFGVSAVAMGVMMASSNHTVDKIAEMVMYAGMLGPLLIPLGGKMVAGFKLATAAAAETTGAMAGMRAGASAVLMAMNPVTLAITAAAVAIGAGAYAWYKWHKHQQQIISDQIAAQKAITNTAKNWADEMGVVEKHYQRISFMQSNIQGAGLGQSQFNKDVKYYTTDSAGMDSVNAFKNQSPDDQTTSALKLYSDLIVKYGLNAKQAQANVSAFLVASGKDFFTATREAAQLGDALGNISGHLMDWRDSVRVGGQYLLNIASSSDKSAAKVKELSDATQGFAQTFSAAFSQSKTPQQVQHLMEELKKTVLNGWQNILNQIKANPLGADFLKVNKIDSAKGLEEWARTHDNNVAGPFKTMIEDQKTFEANLIRETGYSLGLGKNFQWMDQLFGDMLVKTKQMNFRQASTEAANLANSVIQGPLGSMLGMSGSKGVMSNKGLVAQFKAASRAMPTKALDDMATNMTKIAAAQGIKQAKEPWLQLSYILNNVKVGMKGTGDSAKKAADDVKGVKSSLDNLPKMVSITLNKKEMVTTVHDAMSAVQGDMVTSAQANFNSNWDATMASAQAAWDKKQTALQNRQGNASDALQNRQQAAQDAMDKHFQQAQDNINKRYQDRIDAINKTIKAEQKADEQRQRMYEAEKKRLQDLADMANKNIDFNSAINSGNFDEAAKIRNDMESQQAANSLDAIEARRSARVQAAVDRLQKKIDGLEKMRDKELKRLQNVEDAQKKHLERMQSAQTKALEKRQKAESDALAAKEAADMASQQRTRDFEEAMLNQRLDLFQTYVAKNQKDLERWMRKVGLTYNDFGSDIKAKGESWASYFQKALHDHIIQGATQIKNDKMWDSITPKLAAKLLKGLGFNSLNAFQKFVTTGRLTMERNHRKGNTQLTPHGGGMIGHDKTMNRKGLRGAQGGLHGSETWARVQKGEYVVNRKAAYKHRRALDFINRDASGGYSKDAKGGPSGVAPIVGYPAAMMAQGFTAGTMKASAAAMKRSKKAARRIMRHVAGKSGTTDGGFTQGVGGRHRPMPGGFGITNYHGVEDGYNAGDLAAPIGTPVYAVADGRITSSYDIRGYEPRRMMYGQTGPSVQDGFKSYGRVIKMAFDGGGGAVFAHLSQRYAGLGQKVKGGAKIGASGNTGNVQSSSGNGAHLHFGTVPMSPYAFLRKGGEVRFNNTPALLHKGETVLTDNLTKQFKDRVASGGGNTYNIGVTVDGSDASAQEIANTVLKTIRREERRGPTTRRNRGN